MADQQITQLTELTTAPNNTDVYAIVDTAGTATTKKIKWSTIKTALKSYFDTIYQPLSGILTNTTASFTTALETKLNGVEALADVTDATNVDAAGAVMNGDTSTAAMSFVVDEDDMSSNSATKVPTQQSVKAYVDANSGGAPGGSDGEIQFNDSGSFEGSPNLVYDDTTLTIIGDSNPVTEIRRTSSSTNTATTTLKLKGKTSANMTTGFGTNIEFFIEDDANTENKIASISAVSYAADDTGMLSLHTAQGGVSAIRLLLSHDGATFGPPVFVTSLTTTGGIELGHASDTTLTRVSAGRIAVEGVNVVTVSSTDTLTNKTLTSPTLTSPVLGTPASGTLTNCTGLPISGLTASTSTALGVGSLELGHASDTTITRSSAGVIAIEGVTVPLNSITNTHTASTIELGHASDTTISRAAAGQIAVEGVAVPTISSTNTLTNKRTQPRSSTAASGDISPDLASANIYRTAISAGITINAPTGTPVLGEVLVFLIKDNGTSRSLTWNATFKAMGAALPTATTISKRLMVTCQYDGTDWLAIAATEQ